MDNIDWVLLFGNYFGNIELFGIWIYGLGFSRRDFQSKFVKVINFIAIE